MFYFFYFILLSTLLGGSPVIETPISFSIVLIKGFFNLLILGILTGLAVDGLFSVGFATDAGFVILIAGFVTLFVGFVMFVITFLLFFSGLPS